MDIKKKNIIILATGGTIASQGKAGATTNYGLGRFDVQFLIDVVPNLQEVANIEGEQVCNIRSSDMTRDIWLKLAQRINELAKRPDIDGFVITHGTDTLEETSYFLHLTVKTEKPVVMTGAMRPPTATSADGPLNLFQAVVTAASEKSIGQGVLVVFGDTIFSGREVQKVSNFKTNAFCEKDFGCLGYVRNRDVYYVNRSVYPHTLNTEFDLSDVKELPKVSIGYFSLDEDIAILECLEKISDGIVIAGVGGSALSFKWLDRIDLIIKNGKPVVRSTRVANGITLHDLKMDEHARTIPAYTLPPQKAKILLMLALTKTSDLSEIEITFSKY